MVSYRKPIKSCVQVRQDRSQRSAILRLTELAEVTLELGK